MSGLPVTFLFVPGNRPDRFGKAFAAGPDRVIVDLEDAVGQGQKEEARRLVADADLDLPRTVIRINDASTDHFAGDLEMVRGLAPGAVMLPKSHDVGTIARLRSAVGPDVAILPQIESAAGLAGLGDILREPNVERAVFGHLDYSVDLGCAPEWEPLLHARSQIVYQSRLAGAHPPVDSVTTEVKDAQRAGEDGRRALKLGFGGKLLIHPAQIEPVREAFLPSDEERDWALRVLAALEENSGGAATVDGKMIDKPVEDAARRILSRAEGRPQGN